MGLKHQRDYIASPSRLARLDGASNLDRAQSDEDLAHSLRVEVSRESPLWKEEQMVKAKKAAYMAWRMALPYKKYWVVAPNPPIDLNLVFADNALIRTLNHKYRFIDEPTNVLAFPADLPHNLGDVVLAMEIVRAQAKDQHICLDDHIAHLVIHGTLHLLGFTHDHHKDAKRMEGLEIATLNDMGIDNPYETSQLHV